MKGRNLKTTAYLALGSNLGDREMQLYEARKLIALHPSIEIQKVSQIYETEPWPKYAIENGRVLEESAQRWHLNQIICINTRLSAQTLLKATEAMEVQMGKEKKETWGSRTIDIDILLYGNAILHSPKLIIPHQYMNERQFVLVPLVKLAPELIDPRSGRKFKDILNDIEHDHSVLPYSE